MTFFTARDVDFPIKFVNGRKFFTYCSIFFFLKKNSVSKIPKSF